MKRCNQLKVLRTSRKGASIVSTGALYAAIGPVLYEQCRGMFSYKQYRGMFSYNLDFPDPGPVEQWLKHNWEAVEKHRKPKEKKCRKKKKSSQRKK